MDNNEQFIHLDKKLDLVISSAAETKTDIALIKVDVANHIARTDALQNKVELHETKMTEFTTAVRFIKILAGAVCAIISVVEAISQIIRHL